MLYTNLTHPNSTNTTNVKVYCRMRPYNKREIDLGIGHCPITMTDKTVVIRDKKYTFDHNFNDSATQEDVFNVVGNRIIDDFMEGYNATQFVYGQTGAGKTWTIMGQEPHIGLIPRSVSGIFQRIEELPDDWSFEITVSYLELYMEKINDLLNIDKQNLEIKENAARGIYIDKLTHKNISTLSDVYNILEYGGKIRKVAATKMNTNSSRSHSVLGIRLEQIRPDSTKIVSQLNMVDLAGSEKISKSGVTGIQLKQAITINLSLSTLCFGYT